jgi:hypothetical protein
MISENKRLSSSTRFYRKIHRWVAVPLMLFMLLMGITGLLLGWKKQTNLLPKTEKGQSNQSGQWISVDSLVQIAKNHATTVLKTSDEIDRIDIRPQKGIAKIVFTTHFTELQIDCQTGKILAVNTRKSDIIEKIHDGSLLDFWFNTTNDFIKLGYTTMLSLGLILLSISGFWLWYNPIRIRKNKV